MEETFERVDDRRLQAPVRTKGSLDTGVAVDPRLRKTWGQSQAAISAGGFHKIEQSKAGTGDGTG
jgi:hypothetical protein